MERLLNMMDGTGKVLAYLGWVMFGGLLLLYYRLWTSAGAVELRKMSDELAKARKAIVELEKLTLELKNRNDELHTINTRLHADYVDLRDQHSRLNVAFGKLGESVADMREKYDAQFMELMRAKAKNGDL